MVNFPAWDMNYVHPYYHYTTIAAIIGTFVTFIFGPRAIYLYHAMKRLHKEYKDGDLSTRSLDTQHTLFEESDHLMHPELQREEANKRVLFTHGINVRNDLVITCIAIRVFQATLMGCFALVTIWGDIYCCPNHTGICPPPRRGASGVDVGDCTVDEFAPLLCPVLDNWISAGSYPWFGDRDRQGAFCDLCDTCDAALRVEAAKGCEIVLPEVNISALVNATCGRCFEKQHIYALTPWECRISAMGNQYLFAAAYTTTCLFLATLNFGNLSKWSSFLLVQGVAFTTTMVMWGFTPEGPTKQKFSRTLPWCWIPDANTRGADQQLTLTVLQVVCEFITIPVCLILGIRALRQMTLFYRKYPLSRDAVDRRLVPQVVLIVCELSIALVARIWDADDRNHFKQSMVIIDSFLYPATGGITALIWAYGEGIFMTLINPTRSLRNERLTMLPFSVIGNYYRAQQSTEELFRRGASRGTSNAVSPTISARVFVRCEDD